LKIRILSSLGKLPFLLLCNERDEVGCVLLVKAQKEELGELQSLVGQMMQHEGLNSDIKLAVFQEVVDARAFKI
jgi:hypothetical protein